MPYVGITCMHLSICDKYQRLNHLLECFEMESKHEFCENRLSDSCTVLYCTVPYRMYGHPV